MDRLTVEQIAKAVSGKIVSGDGRYEVSAVCTDSREAGADDIFFPLIGENFDAHKFIPQVVERGCKVIVMSDEKLAEDYTDKDVILVEDTLLALQELAKWYIEKLNIKKIAVTGSVGKTSTRDLVCAGMRKKYVTGTNRKNFNNQIGLPLTIMELTSDNEAVVLEMGMDRKGEIHRLVDIARPDVAVITNIGISHIEHLGSREGIRDAKLEVTDFFGSENTLIVNGKDDMLKEYDFPDRYNVIKVGGEGDSQYVENIQDMGADGIAFDLFDGEKLHKVSLAQPGAHNAINVMLAVSACAQFGVSTEDVIDAAKNVAVTGNRLRVKEAGSVRIIDDSYNAAPSSMKSAIETLRNTKGGRKIAILGDMFELGSEEKRLHREVGQFAAGKGIDLLITVGELGKEISEGAKEGMPAEAVMHFDSRDKLTAAIGEIIRSEDVVLLKASRGMELEHVTEKIMEKEY